MWFIYLVVGSLLLLGLMAIGELIVQNSPESKFSKWWRKYVVFECQECD
jgi:hypothetical protein